MFMTRRINSAERLFQACWLYCLRVLICVCCSLSLSCDQAAKKRDDTKSSINESSALEIIQKTEGTEKPMLPITAENVYLTGIQEVDQVCVFRLDFDLKMDVPVNADDEPLSLLTDEGEAVPFYKDARAQVYFSPYKDLKKAYMAGLTRINYKAKDPFYAEIKLQDPPDKPQYVYVRYQSQASSYGLGAFSRPIVLPACRPMYKKSKEDQLVFQSDTYLNLKQFINCPENPKYKRKQDINKHTSDSDYSVEKTDFLGALYTCDDAFEECHIHRRYLPQDTLEPAVTFKLTHRTEEFREIILEVIEMFNEVSRDLKLTQEGQQLVRLSESSSPYYLSCWEDFIELVPQSNGYLEKWGGASFSKYSEKGQIFVADIISNRNQIVDQKGQVNEDLLRYHFAHEIGHALGMSHNFVSKENGQTSFMDYLNHEEAMENKGDFRDYERAVLKYLYSSQNNAHAFYQTLSTGRKAPWKLLRKDKTKDRQVK